MIVESNFSLELPLVRNALNCACLWMFSELSLNGLSLSLSLSLSLFSLPVSLFLSLLPSRRLETGRRRAKREHLKRFWGLLIESRDQNLVLTVLYVLSLLDSGHIR